MRVTCSVCISSGRSGEEWGEGFSGPFLLQLCIFQGGISYLGSLSFGGLIFLSSVRSFLPISSTLVLVLHTEELISYNLLVNNQPFISSQMIYFSQLNGHRAPS